MRFAFGTSSASQRLHPRWMDYRMQAGDEAVNGSPTLRIGERHTSSNRRRQAVIAKAILHLTFVLIGERVERGEKIPLSNSNSKLQLISPTRTNLKLANKRASLTLRLNASRRRATLWEKFGVWPRSTRGATRRRRVSACSQVVCCPSSCQRTTLLRCQNRSRSILYLTL